MKRVLLLTMIAALVLTACSSSAPAKYSLEKINLCEVMQTSYRGIPYTKLSQANCAVAIAPVDLSLWHQAPMNAYKSRGAETAELGCRPLTRQVDNCTYCGPVGNSTTLMMNFDPTAYASASKVQRAVLAVYSPGQVQGLKDAYLRGRSYIGDALSSLAQQREIVLDSGEHNQDYGWVLYDVTYFVARAINDRRNSIHFEVSVPCQTPATNQVTVGVTRHEPQLLVEFN